MDRETVDEIKRHFDVVIESLDSKVQLVAEGLVATRDELKRDISALDERLTQQLRDHGQQLRDHGQQIRGLQEAVTRIEQKLDRKADVEAVAALEGRVAVLEREHR